MILRGIFGFPIGITIGYIITILVSVHIGDGLFHPINIELIKMMGNELNAVILQTFLCGIMGTGFAMASVIWEIDSWNIVKQSATYFAIACIIMFPISYIANWMDHSVTGILSYAGIFTAIFVFTWLIQYCLWKNKVKKINEVIKQRNE